MEEKNVSTKILLTACASAMLLSACAGGGKDSGSGLGFFVTSTGSGKGADLGGLSGADQHCQKLASAVGAGNRTWRAYLSTQAAGSTAAVNARDRIGNGPWRNAKGEIVASSVEELHGKNNLTKQTAVNERGEIVNGRGDKPNRHDILTGSTPDGRSPGPGKDLTCSNWTSSDGGSAIVGHHDRLGLRDDEPSRSWNSSHPTKGCSQQALISTGGDGLLYCFAAR
jgi:hypothetical protein